MVNSETDRFITKEKRQYDSLDAKIEKDLEEAIEREKSPGEGEKSHLRGKRLGMQLKWCQIAFGTKIGSLRRLFLMSKSSSSSPSSINPERSASTRMEVLRRRAFFAISAAF